MPTAAEHIAQAIQNEEFPDSIRSIGSSANWGVTVLFYAAVHYGRALLAGKSNPVTTHQHFQSVFLRLTGDFVAYGYYRALQTESEAARYDCKKYEWSDVDALNSGSFAPFKIALKKLGLSF